MDNHKLPYDELNDALEEMQNAIVTIHDAVFSTTYSDFMDDQQMVHTVLEGFDALSLNVVKIPREVRADHPEVAWGQLDNLSTVLSNEFHEVDLDAVWEMANELDILLEAITTIIDGLDEYC